MICTTEQIVNLDECPQKLRFSIDYEPVRVTLATALYKSLAEGLKSGLPAQAESKFMQLAAFPGLAVQGLNVYEIARHHSKLLEILTTYLLGGAKEKWHRPPTQRLAGDLLYRPQSYVETGKLRRVVLASSWSADRELEERNSWRSIGDIVAMERPMIVNVIVIGQLRNGFRNSFWTSALSHPQNRQIRFQGAALNATGKWNPIRRENSVLDTLEWLRLMQQDNCFESLVHSFEIPIPEDSERVHTQLQAMLREANALPTGNLYRRRSSCYRAFYPCQFANVCPKGFETPPETLFQLKK